MRPIFCALMILAMSTPLAAKPPLNQVAEIDDGLMAIAIADALRKDCDGIDARLLRALSTINGLKSRAKQLGYSSDEIDAYVNSGAEKARMRDKATAFLASKGVQQSDNSGFCAFGKAQMASGSAIGRLLR